MESPAGYPDSPMEQDDASYPCKGCGEVRETPLLTSAPHAISETADVRRLCFRFWKKARRSNLVSIGVVLDPPEPAR